MTSSADSGVLACFVSLTPFDKISTTHITLNFVYMYSFVYFKNVFMIDREHILSLCLRPTIPPAHNAADPLCHRPTMQPRHNAAVPLCRRPAMPPSRYAADPLCRRPTMPPTRYAAEPQCRRPAMLPSSCAADPLCRRGMTVFIFLENTLQDAMICNASTHELHVFVVNESRPPQTE